MDSDPSAVSRKRPLPSATPSSPSDFKRQRQDGPSSSSPLHTPASASGTSSAQPGWTEDQNAPLPPRPNAPERPSHGEESVDGPDDYSFSPLADDLLRGGNGGGGTSARDGKSSDAEDGALEEGADGGDGRQTQDAEEGELPFSPPYEGPGDPVKAGTASGATQENGSHTASATSSSSAHFAPPDLPPLVGVTQVTDYDLYDTVGEGTFGVVRVGKEKATGKVVALKRIIIPEGDKDGFPVTALRELSLLKSLRHPNILRLLSIAVSPSNRTARTRGDVYMVFEYYPHDLAGLLENNEVLMDLAQVKMYIRQVMEGMKYLHASNIMHRDIKTANILVSDAGLVKIADFGLARPLDTSDRNREYTDKVVTRWYRPPELLMESARYDQAVDMWGVGCVFGELLLKRPIFPGRDDIDQLRLIFETTGTPTDDLWPGYRSLPLFRRNPDVLQMEYRRRQVRKRFERFGLGVVELLDGLLELNPERRWTAEGCLRHWWFTDRGGKEAEIGRCVWRGFNGGAPPICHLIVVIVFVFWNLI
ncbi:Pkinase-domain-containing protein [Gonapodya prolifera JEL478]|uniref:Pkinase-domain-containing protein n=1 Tax=Gonapodya prolifera (strain JEL478) TaxID=1344416 RepID=A0A139ARD6_GONPJ|nr:Pkinase-domain-containing protein [Gonapodya prolifera JEL478]|eukprot:KXS19289.1 Pkinase-domain-containing protein [Gonapodya prolifera JEL478]